MPSTPAPASLPLPLKLLMVVLPSDSPSRPEVRRSLEARTSALTRAPELPVLNEEPEGVDIIPRGVLGPVEACWVVR